MAVAIKTYYEKREALVVSDKDRQILRDLAKRARELADSPEMAARKQMWKDLHDLKPQRPMLIFDHFWIDGFLGDRELKCENPVLRNVEQNLVYKLMQCEEFGDDAVLEPYFRIGWQGTNLHQTGTDFGEIKIVEDHAKEGGLAFKSVFPIKTPDDIKRMTPRTFSVDREPALEMQEILQDCFGDYLPVLLGNFDNFCPDIGNQLFLGNYFLGVTWDVFKLIGAEAMMLWPYDHPDALQELLRFLVEDKKRFFNYIIEQGIAISNTDSQFAGPTAYGYVSDLPQNKTEGVVLKDLWAWGESQETQMMSPGMFDEIYLPHIAELANMFGLLYYGCCERVDNKFEYLTNRIHNIRSFSISGWSDVDAFTEKLGSNYVASKKPIPGLVSSPTAEWDKMKEEAEQTWAACKRNNSPLEVIFRDVYAKTVTPDRAVKWIKIWKETIGIE